MKNFCLTNLCLFGLSILLIQACGGENKRDIPDVSHIELDLTIDRYDQALFSLDTNAVFLEEFQKLYSTYPEFTKLFSQNILQVGPMDAPTEAQLDYWKGFIQFPAIRQLADTISRVFPDFNIYKKDFDDALKRFQYYFPQQPTPQKITTFISEYSYAAFIYGNNELAVGLDMFLGAQHPYSKNNPGNPYFSDYLVRAYNKDHLVSKTIQTLIDDLVGQAKGTKLLDLMVHNGKKLYILDQLLPFASDSIKLETTAAQTKWLVDNELEMWTYFQHEELLYSSKMKDINKLVDYSPSGSPILPEESPGRAANYVGWQIIKQFMEKNPQIPLSELLTYQDAQEILDLSKYKPKRK